MKIKFFNDCSIDIKLPFLYYLLKCMINDEFKINLIFLKS